MRPTEQQSERAGAREELLVGRYRLKQLLGSGAMGWVFEASDLSLGEQTVALKLFYPHIATASGTRAALHQELLITRRLSHPNIVQTYTFETDGDQRCFMTMECVEGGTLRQLLTHATPDSDRALSLLFGIAKGISFAHQCGVIHRDLKPDNILLGSDGEPKIVDFGIAQLVRSGGLGVTGGIAGTPLYMSPEQFEGAVLTHASDIYAFGVLAFELLYRRPLFAAGTVYELAERHLTEPVRLPESGGRVPEWCEQTLLRCLEKDPKRRFESMQEVVAVIAEGLGRAVEQTEVPAVAGAAGEEKPASQIWKHVEEEVVPITMGRAALCAFGVIVCSAGWMVQQVAAWIVVGLFFLIVLLSTFWPRRAAFWIVTFAFAFTVLFGLRSNHEARKAWGGAMLYIERTTGIDLRLLKQLGRCNISANSIDDLMWAAAGAEKEEPLRKLLLAGVDPNVHSKAHGGKTPLHVAVTFWRHGPYTSLLAAGANPNAVDDDGNSPLHLAAAYNDPGHVSTLLKHGADPNLRNKRGETPLSKAIEARLTRNAILLLGRGADPDTQWNDGASVALHSAVEHQDVELLGALVTKGVNVNAVDAAGDTALHVAVRQNPRGANFEFITRWLYKIGGDLTIKNHQGQSVWGAAKQRPDFLVLRRLEEAVGLPSPE